MLQQPFDWAWSAPKARNESSRWPSDYFVWESFLFGAKAAGDDGPTNKQRRWWGPCVSARIWNQSADWRCCCRPSLCDPCGVDHFSVVFPFAPMIAPLKALDLDGKRRWFISRDASPSTLAGINRTWCKIDDSKETHSWIIRRAHSSKRWRITRSVQDPLSGIVIHVTPCSFLVMNHFF